ncbi:MAG: helix-turn-helix domain-containing protein [Mycobacteriales bacterium]
MPERSTQLGALGRLIREQRQLAQLSLRKLAELAEVSNPYLSQIERGLHEPSVRVLHSVARALNLSAETLLEQAGLVDRTLAGSGDSVKTEDAIRADPRLTAEQKTALLGVYRSYLAAGDR